MALSLCACGRQDKPITLDPIGRDVCEKTSFFQMAETETGYYLNFDGELSYADKSDLTNWVQVCNEPDCLHRGDECPANIYPGGFWFRDGRIYSIRDPSCIDKNSTTVGAICSTALDGTDLRLEYPLEMLEGGGLNYYATPEPDRMYLSVCKLETDGTFTYRLGRLDENGMDILLEESLTDEVQGFMPQADM